MSIKALSDYTFYSRYSQYLPELSRRETWGEAVSRVFDMHREYYKDKILENPELADEINFAESQAKKKRVLASQRSLQFASEPILRHHLKIYNCLTTYIDRERVFQEMMYALLCGCGAGFSVQRHHVKQLPEIKEPSKKNKIFVIEDSIEGWADAVGCLLSSWWKKEPNEFKDYEGLTVEFDYSKIRPEGSLIAGRFKAPGPEGLKTSLEKIRKVLASRFSSEFFDLGEFKGKLRPIDAYDIIMHISDAVLSGGVRRSATLSLFSHDDEEMMNAKTGDWFIKNPQRGRSNNSAALLKGHVSKEEFSKLMESAKQFGEPGFIWVDNLEIVYNPCLTENTNVLTKDGPRKVRDLIGKEFVAIVNGKEYPSTYKGFFKTGSNREVFQLNTVEGFNIELTDNHKVLLDNGVWKEAGDLVDGDKIVIHNHGKNEWNGLGNRNEGWLVGNLLGDGTFSGERAYLDYWGTESEYLPEKAISMIYEENLNTYQNITGGKQISPNVEKRRVSSVGLKRLAEKCGINSSKDIQDQIFYTSSDFVKGFLSGWFDADGSVQGNLQKGVSIRLSSSKLKNLEIAQKLLHYLGIYSKIYANRRDAGYRLLPDGKGGQKEYWCEASHDLIISKEDIIAFDDTIGFFNKENAIKLQSLISSYSRNPNRTQRVGTFKSLVFLRKEDVYDCTIPEVHAFDAEGLYVHNCVEIAMRPKTIDGVSGWSACNLTEINGKFCNSKEEFLQACRASSIIGTLQAGYTKLNYFTQASINIFEEEALLGCSVTGWMDNPEILFDPEIQKEGAKEVLKVNDRVARLIGIKTAARATCVKPAGSTSCVLGTASGIHPHHAKRYIRRAQVNRSEFCGQAFQKINPSAVEKSVWSASGTDNVISFLCEVPSGAIVKNQISAIDLLEKVKLTQQNWVEYGTRVERCVIPELRHNVSNTINVQYHEWKDVEDFIFENQKFFAGISLLSASGDLDYTQAPFSTVLTPNELVREYGDASIFASGLIVDGLSAFDGNLWKACDTVLGHGEDISTILSEPKYPQKRSNKELAEYFISKEKYDELFLKQDWVRRVKQFSERYFNNDLRKATYCLKHVSLWKTWCDLKRDYKDIDWTSITEQNREHKNANEQAAAACAGGKCELI